MKFLRNLSVHSKIFIGWGFVITGGLYGFVLSKRQIISRRYENMKIRERMRNEDEEDFSKEILERRLSW